MFYEINGHLVNAESIQYITPDGVIHVGGGEIPARSPKELEELKRVLKTKKLVSAAGGPPEVQDALPEFNPDLKPDDVATNTKGAKKPPPKDMGK